ncbi:hypothetical protein PAXRUDRAFT_51078, partial [Paxillus rubicundulus Ve08.2h10]
MRTGKGLCNLFSIILLHCNPVDPHRLWEATRVHLYNDILLYYILCRSSHSITNYLTHRLNIQEPTEEQVFDYGLY